MGRSVVSTANDYYSLGNSDEVPEHSATVASFALDKYEVTVGRFRKFVNAYGGWHAGATVNPVDNAGAHPIAAYTGWGHSWNASSSDLPASASDLKTELNCDSTYQTWTDGGTGNENYPINCVNWFEAFAFCIWDGGRLPTEAEWEYAAAGGTQNYLYPWGINDPDATRANYVGSADTPHIAVGSYVAGNSYWGHADLAGSMSELAFDLYSSSYYGTSSNPAPCNNCANTIPDASFIARVVRGGFWGYSELRAAYRNAKAPPDRAIGLGFRCARTP